MLPVSMSVPLPVLSRPPVVVPLPPLAMTVSMSISGVLALRMLESATSKVR